MTKNIIDCAQILIDKKLTLAFAESATAGLLCGEFSLVHHAGKFLKGSLACYDAELKKSLLRVPEKLIKILTPESLEVTDAMCTGLARLIPADIHVSVTGLTCPGGSETAEKPVGTMFIVAYLHSNRLFAERRYFKGTEKEIINSTIIETANLLIQALQT